MKSSKLKYVTGMVALAVWLAPSVGWSTRAYGPLVSGVITAAPQTGSIEIAHHVYLVRANSAAAKALSSLHAGQTVDAVLDGAPDSATSEIIVITQHVGS